MFVNTEITIKCSCLSNNHIFLRAVWLSFNSAMAQCSLAGKSLLPSLLFYRTQGAKPCQVVAEIFSRPPQGKTSHLLLHFPLLIFHVYSYYRECENERTMQNPQPKPLPWRAIFPTFQPHLVQICLALLDLHPSVIHSTSQSIFLNALCHYSVPGLCSYETPTMAVTLMESSPVPLEKPPHPPSITLHPAV